MQPSLLARRSQDHFTITNLDRADVGDGAVFREIISQRTRTVFPIQEIVRHWLAIEGNALQSRLGKRCSCTGLNGDVATEIIPGLPKEFAKRHAGLQK